MNKNIFLLVAGLFFGHLTVAQNIEVPARLKFANLQLHLNQDARRQVSQKIEQITSDTAFLRSTREKVYTYMPIVMRVLKAQSVPEDLAYLALKETEFLQSSADDRKVSAGVWKITPNQNEDWRLNLQINNKVDERKHMGLATAAVARKLKNDNYTLRNWINTIMAFGFGFSEVSQTSSSDDKGKDSYDFHAQTNPYLIDLVAYFLVFKPEFKPTDKSITLLEYSDTKGKDLENLGKLVGISAAQLKTYNTWLLGNTVPKEGHYTVYFPAKEDQKTQMKDALTKNNTTLPVEQYQQFDYPIIVKKQQINVDNKSYQLIAANGLSAITVDTKDKAENILKVANTISMRKFLKYNDITEKDSILPNVVYYLEQKNKVAITPFHELKKGETYWLVAQKYGMQYEKLIDFNRIAKGEKEQIGRLLWLADQRPKETMVEVRQTFIEEAEPEIIKNITPAITKNGLSEDDKGTYYTTENTETVYQIAEKFRITLDSLRMLNPQIGTSMVVESNTKLVLGQKNNQKPVTPNPENNGVIATKGNENTSVKEIAEAVIKANQADANTKTNIELTHTVQKGEWLNVIAKRYGVSPSDIMLWNNITTANNLKANDKLLIKNPKQGYSVADVRVATGNAKTENTVPNRGDNTAKKDVTITEMGNNMALEQPFLKDSVYLVRQDGETFQSIEKKMSLKQIQGFNYSLYMVTWNNPDPNVPPIGFDTPLTKGTTVKLSQNAKQPTAEQITKALNTGTTTVATNGQNTQNTNTQNTVNTQNSGNQVVSNPIPTEIPTTTNPTLNLTVEKTVMYQDYKDSIYTVGTGDYLYSIAKKTGVPDYRYLMRWNNITDENKKLDIGDRLVVKGDLSKDINYQPISNGKYHVTQFKENIYEIAKLYNTKADSIAKWNNIMVDSLLPVGKSLLVRKGSMHTVQTGETLKKIAENYGMKPEQLAALNKMGLKDVIKPNQVLLIDEDASLNKGVLAATQNNSQNANSNTNTTTKNVGTATLGENIYLVRKDGESLKSIAEKLKMPDVNGFPFYLYMKTWNGIEDENTMLPKGKAIKIAENAIMPNQQQIDAAMQNTEFTQVQNEKTQTQNTKNAQNANINPDALLTSPINTNTADNKKNLYVQPFKDVYVVKMPNETLKTIAEKYNFQAIGGYEYYLYMKSWNGIEDENAALAIGKAIRLTETANLPTEAEVLQILPPPSAAINTGKHIVSKGETIYTIAKQYNVDVKYLEVWNKIDDNTSLNAGQELIVRGDMRVEVPKYDKMYTDRYHIVQHGETLSEIAAFHKIKVEDLKIWNNLTNNNLTEEQQLWIIPKPKMHTVSQGETLSIVASQYGLTLEDIANFNQLPLDYKTKVGEILIVDAAAMLPRPMIKDEKESITVPTNANTATNTATEVVNPQNVPETYFAQFGETVQDICTRFGISTIDFKLWNKLSYEVNKLEGGRKYYLKNPPITVPPAASGTPTGNGKYKVGKNETLYTIARKFNVTIYQLREWNNLKVDAIKEGDNLVVSKQ